MTSEKDGKEEEFVFEFYDEDYAESLEEEISSFLDDPSTELQFRLIVRTH